MIKKAWIAVTMIISSMFISNIYAADESSSLQQGVQGYDWQTCINSKSGDCINACLTSENKDCKDNCNAMAKAKCQSEGLIPPP